jgi:hypothetical protein
MKIENSNIKNPVSVYSSSNTNKQSAQVSAAVTANASSAKTDKLEVSEKAKNYSQIYDKIKNGEYDKPEVINAVARKLAKYLEKE